LVGLTSVPVILVPVPAIPPVTPPVTTAAPHEYVVPAGTTPLVIFIGVEVNVPPLHIVAVMSVTEGIGLTVTVTVNVAPVQLPAVGVTVYIAVCGVFVGLVSVPLMFATAVPAAPPVIPPVTAGAAHVYVVGTGTKPFVPSAGNAVNDPSLQITSVIFVIAGFGFTVTVTVKVTPVQLPDVGVTVYVAVWTAFVGLVRVPEILTPAPANPPVTPPVTAGAVQVYVVPVGTIPFVPVTGVTLKLPLLQIVLVIGVIAGVGSTVTVTVKVAPVQLPEVGVTV